MFHTSLSRKQVKLNTTTIHTVLVGVVALQELKQRRLRAALNERAFWVLYKIKTYDLFSSETATVKPWKKFLKRPELIIY